MKRAIYATAVILMGSAMLATSGVMASSAATPNPSVEPLSVTASQPILRTGQIVQLWAEAPAPLQPGQSLVIVDTSTGQIIGQTRTGSTVGATYETSSPTTQTFQAEVLGKPVTVQWIDEGIGTNPGYQNAAGDTVTLDAPLTASPGSPITVTANGTGFSHPVYQFWWAPQGGSWVSSGPFSADAQFTFTPPSAGLYDVVAYAREANAPTHETAAQRAQYEAKSDTAVVTVAGSASGSGNTGGGNVPTLASDAFVGLWTNNQVSLGTPIIVTADVNDIPNPVYQFWVKTPSGTWESSGHYQPSNTFTIPTTQPGTWVVMAYARPSNAPSNESVAERALTTAASPLTDIVVHP
ncbi:hypothetical protein Sulac_2248 [Sulfobacillus acidophilus DSM 10332]|uniref:Ig-like domain-containing protein n=1 Tax=Sulfobacillus acidophilus (strain ATCC 700253 / DSM 10332 / NAL) TaxID=679936 RepID=G8TU49_SULAD|nr:hypothetical protein Sulac_2248 [Sulfobacillus acidophilus DSM 10332]